jgi:DNA polymerase-3 subunit delta'
MPTLRDILGQPAAVANLCAALRSGRVHHAWIFHGPEGVGKRTAAEAFGAALLDSTTRERECGLFEPDPDTETQRLVAAGTHPDLHVITKELARFSDDRAVRERKLISIPREVIDQHLIGPAQLAPSMRSNARATKVFIVDEAELLNATTQNAVLKTLEEPPAGAVIILVTSSEERLLPTIRSRCQRVAFGPLDEGAMKAWMQMHGISAPATRGAGAWAASFAAGSPGRLTQALEGGMAEWGRALEPMLAAADRGEYDAGLGASMAELIDGWAKAWVDAHEGASKDAANKAGAARLLGMLAERSRLMLRDVATRGGDPDPALAALDLIEATRRDIESNVNQKQAFEHLAAGLAGARV